MEKGDFCERGIIRNMERGFPFGVGSFLIIAAIVGVVLLWQQGWNPFPPKDHEDCIESAAKSAKSKEAKPPRAWPRSLRA
jgi:hypothetical protein